MNERKKQAKELQRILFFSHFILSPVDLRKRFDVAVAAA